MSDQPLGGVFGPEIRRSWVVTLLTNLWLRAAILVVVLVIGLTIGVRIDREAGVDGVREAAAALGLLGPLVYAAVYVVAGTVLLPAAPFSIGAGVLFGPVVGALTAFVGATLGAIGAFYLGRLLGRSAVEHIGGRHVAALDRYLSERGFMSVLVVRLAPLFPFNLINVCAGVSGITLRPYLSATVIGIIPGTIVYATLGGTIDEPASAAFVAAVTISVIAVGVGVALKRRARRRRNSDLRPDVPGGIGESYDR